MGVWVRVADGVLEALLLRRAEQRVLAVEPSRRVQARQLVAAASHRIDAAREIASPSRAGTLVGLLREGIGLLVAARHVLAGIALEEALREVHAPADALARLVRELPNPPEWASSVDALRETDPMALDQTPREQAERRTWALFDAAEWLRSSIDLRTPVYVRGTRVGRVGALVLTAVWMAGVLVPRMQGPRPIATGKPVTLSSHASESAEPSKATDGDPSSHSAVETTVESQPWVTVDLQGLYSVEEVHVWGSDSQAEQVCRSIRLEVSRDGVEFTRIAVGDTALPRAGRWEARLSEPAHAQFVRLRSRSVCKLSITEIEVMGRR